ncbi:hypothetical protein QJS66_02075 [Kocuria rhizophila]|nr:hypothetical protein QJS66_02075 [Kocuria rhizophila]
MNLTSIRLLTNNPGQDQQARGPRDHRGGDGDQVPARTERRLPCASSAAACTTTSPPHTRDSSADTEPHHRCHDPRPPPACTRVAVVAASWHATIIDGLRGRRRALADLPPTANSGGSVSPAASAARRGEPPGR